MNTKRYIKVTPKGAKKAVVLLATNKDFYASQGATIEEPTEEEVLAAFPELRTEKTNDKVSKLKAEIENLKEENAKLKAELNALSDEKSKADSGKSKDED